MSLYDGNWEPFLFLKLLIDDLRIVIERAKKKGKWRDAFSMGKTYYSILGVPENASLDEITKAYRNQVRFFHPDVFKGAPEIAHAKTAELNEAYEVLANRETRANYDAWLKKQREAQRQRSASSEQSNREKQNVESDKKSSPNVSNTQTKIRTQTIVIIVLVLVVAFYFISDTIERQSREIEDLRIQLEEALEENRAKEQNEINLMSQIEEISNDLASEEDFNNEYYECLVLTVFYRQAFDHYSILSNVFSLAANSPDYYRKSKANVDFNTRLLTLTMENTTNLFDVYCDDYGFEAQSNLDHIMNDLRSKNEDALMCVLSLGNGEALGASYGLLDKFEDCNNKANDLNAEYWNVFHEFMG